VKLSNEILNKSLNNIECDIEVIVKIVNEIKEENKILNKSKNNVEYDIEVIIKIIDEIRENNIYLYKSVNENLKKKDEEILLLNQSLISLKNDNDKIMNYIQSEEKKRKQRNYLLEFIYMFSLLIVICLFS